MKVFQKNWTKGGIHGLKMNEFVDKKAPKIEGLDFSSNDFTIIYFYPKDNTPGCTLEAKDFTNLLPEFKKLKTIIYGISKDSDKSHTSFIDKHKLKVNLLSDINHKIQEKYGVWRMKKFMGREFMGTVRTTFLVDKKGKIMNIWDNVKARGHVKSVLKYISDLKSK